jgi:hypothetical protein
MSDLKPSAPESVDAVSIQSVKIHAEFLKDPLDISTLVSDLDVFEHLDKPYITAILGFVDIEDVVGVLNISGGERVSITLKSNLEESVPVHKHFFIDKILSSNKVSDNEEFFAMHLIEDIAFLSNLININQSYTGSSSDIIKKIAKVLGRGVNLGLDEADNQEIKVIVPNLTPIDAMCWIKNRITTVDGYPYYLYSTLVGENLNLYDMAKMLKDDAMNILPGEEYTHYESQMSMPADKSKRRVIMAYQAKETYDVYKLIDRGLIGSDYTYLNLTKKEKQKDNTFRFDINKEALDKLASFKQLWQTTHRPLYDKTRYEWSTRVEISSRKITRIGSAQAFDGKKSLSERDEVAQYRLNEVNRSLSQLLVSDPMSFIVNGLDFFNGEENTTVGNKLRVRFLRNTKVGDPTDLFDKKKSGDYLIFACKHSFTPREYTLTFSGVKLSNGDII